jgi:hypothetical protein
MTHKYTSEQAVFIREVAPGRYNKEIADLFNEKFGTALTKDQIRSYKQNHKIQSNVSRKRVTEDDGLFTKEQKDFIKDNVHGISNQKLVDMVNQKFDLSISARQMKSWKNNRHLSSGLKGSEGTEPPNKGTKGLFNVGGNKTSFKKGQKAQNYKPVGSERIDRDGYVLIKVTDEGPWHKRWRHKHKVLWEQANGPIPKGRCILFLDSNKLNLSLDNLHLITNSQLAILNRKNLISDHPEFTKTGIMIADIFGKIGERKRKNESWCKS